jgi:hypothetical protein
VGIVMVKFGLTIFNVKPQFGQVVKWSWPLDPQTILTLWIILNSTCNVQYSLLCKTERFFTWARHIPSCPWTVVVQGLTCNVIQLTAYHRNLSIGKHQASSFIRYNIYSYCEVHWYDVPSEWGICVWYCLFIFLDS